MEEFPLSKLHNEACLSHSMFPCVCVHGCCHVLLSVLVCFHVEHISRLFLCLFCEVLVFLAKRNIVALLDDIFLQL